MRFPHPGALDLGVLISYRARIGQEVITFGPGDRCVNGLLSFIFLSFIFDLQGRAITLLLHMDTADMCATINIIIVWSITKGCLDLTVLYHPSDSL